mgnify:CR=1 FL=1
MGILVSKSKPAFLEYCVNAYKKFFEDSDNLSISNERFVDMLCLDEAVEKDPLSAMVRRMDEDESANITFHELVESMSSVLYKDSKEFEKVTWQDIKEHFKDNEKFQRKLHNSGDQD